MYEYAVNSGWDFINDQNNHNISPQAELEKNKKECIQLKVHVVEAKAELKAATKAATPVSV